MNEILEALVDGRRMGRLTYDSRKDRVGFEYDEGWTEAPAAFPLSLSMSLSKPDHPDAIVRPFITGLLPDNDEVLRRWGKLYQVSARNPFRLLSHVGEECAGAVQFVRPDRAAVWLGGEPPHGVAWLSDDELAERMQDLVSNHAASRRLGDRGQFSLAGAQAKIGLLREDGTGRWGLPEGEIPPKKAKLAMKIGGEYKLDRIGARQWEKAAGEWKLDRRLLGERIVAMAGRLPEAAELVRSEMSGAGAAAGEMLERLVEGIAESCERALEGRD